MSSLKDFEVKFITSQQAYDLRDRVLRGTRSVESNVYAEDELPTTFHVGVVQGERVLSNGTFMQQEHAEFPTAKLPYRLRGMATDPEAQGNGLGKLVLTEALNELSRRQADLIWFNARLTAEDFYRKLGFVALDDIFDIPSVGPHKVMYKWLT